jgi:undecaprenyl diphosphate synthase
MMAAQVRTAGNAAMRVNIAVNYGGRWDIAQAARHLAEAATRGELDPATIEEHLLGEHTCLSELPPPDLFIRTGGERRISNFLLWQLAYTELYFTDTLWPDVDAACLDDAFDDYAGRQRRFGRTGTQVSGQTASH